jgi:hypothetical protein
MRLRKFGVGKRGIVFCFVIGAVFVCMVRPEPAGTGRAQQMGTAQYVERVLTAEAEFALKSPANKNLKRRAPRKYRCMEGHWRVIDERQVFLCD